MRGACYRVFFFFFCPRGDVGVGGGKKRGRMEEGLGIRGSLGEGGVKKNR